MTKTMGINELISKLKEYDGELTVKVWSNGAEKPYPISHVGQGHTDGILDNYVSIVVDEDLEVLSLGVAVKTLTAVLVTFILHSTNPKKVADTIINSIRRAAGGTNDDRNLVDLSKIWHDASEMPKKGEWILIQFDEDCYDTLVLCDLYADIFCARCKKYGDIRWAYICDLLPKGGEK